MHLYPVKKGAVTPGEVIAAEGEIEINAGRRKAKVEVVNTGDRPVQVGSHYHFYETNPALQFARDKTRGYRLDIPAGTAVRFEPGQSREVELVPYAGLRVVYGFRGKVMGALEPPSSGRTRKPLGKPLPKSKKGRRR